MFRKKYITRKHPHPQNPSKIKSMKVTQNYSGTTGRLKAYSQVLIRKIKMISKFMTSSRFL